MLNGYKMGNNKEDVIVLAAGTNFKVQVDFIGGVDEKLDKKVYYYFQLRGRLLRTT